MDLKVIHEPPTLENTIPVLAYRAFSPERFSVEDEDKHVVYSGGSGYHIEVLENDPSSIITVEPKLRLLLAQSVDLYVLNSSVLFWAPLLRLGVELAYPSIVLHAIQHHEGQDRLYIQLLPGDQLLVHTDLDHEPFIEMVIVPTRGCRELPTCPAGSNTIAAIYDGMAQCAALHVDDDSNMDENMEEGIGGGEEIGDTALHQLALSRADDLDVDDCAADHPVGASMSVDVGYATVTGRRKRDDQDTEPSKRRS